MVPFDENDEGYDAADDCDAADDGVDDDFSTTKRAS